MNTYECWGRFPRLAPHKVHQMQWVFDTLPTLAELKILPYGKGRSYGDVCLNEKGLLLDTAPLNHFIEFDRENGLLTCEAGVMLNEILAVIVPLGYFLPTTPGTQFITVGGAIANDVHGKNHHRAGTFGCHVKQFELLRSDGTRLLCSPTENSDWFNATIGGLGLTGLITWAQFKVTPIPSPFLEVDCIKYRNLDEFFEISQDADQKYEHTVAWIDCLARGKSLGRGHFMGGNFVPIDSLKKPPKVPRERSLTIPINAPNFALNSLSIKCFNFLYYHRKLRRVQKSLEYYVPFFYPLDSLLEWNRIYGKRGFFQHQFVVPFEKDFSAIREILNLIAHSKMGSFLAVLKTFGSIASPGILSFPRKGVTLALDFPNQGPHSLNLFEKIDEVVAKHQGVVYPAKDARMSAENFQRFYPNWKELESFIDPQFSSSFWRRVTQ